MNPGWYSNTVNKDPLYGTARVELTSRSRRDVQAILADGRGFDLAQPRPGQLRLRSMRERLADPHVVPFLIEVLEDRREPISVRSHVLKKLRTGGPTAETRPRMGEALVQIVAYPELRLEAALALVVAEH